MADTKTMKKADWILYASELRCKLEKAEAELEAVRNRQIEDVRAEIRSEERKSWVETGLQMVQDEIDVLLEDLYRRDEISFDLRYKLNSAVQSVVDGIDVASIVE